MGDPSCLKDVEVPPCGSGGEILGVSSVPGNQPWWALENSSGGLWRTALVGSGTPSTEAGPELLFPGTLGQAPVPGWALEISACLYQQK